MKYFSTLKHTSLVLVALFLFACNAKDTSLKAVAGTADFADFAMTAITGTTMQKAVKKNPDGEIMEEGTVENGQKNGQWIIYNADNNLPKSITTYVDGLYTGTLIEFNKRGQIEKTTSYINNELNGLYGVYKFGRTVETVNYVNGKMDGVYRKYFNNKDDVQEERTYKNGVLDGALRFFNEEGKVVLEYDYKNGEKIGGGELK
ncbi:MAG: antitoxin component YwqK of YwqJK toxin-antitoxin module [Paraglaciecola sp.]|jgi:antitoxin component YwqK of YwqJK toxin-antitoxin module